MQIAFSPDLFFFLLVCVLTVWDPPKKCYWLCLSNVLQGSNFYGSHFSRYLLRVLYWYGCCFFHFCAAVDCCVTAQRCLFFSVASLFFFFCFCFYFYDLRSSYRVFSCSGTYFAFHSFFLLDRKEYNEENRVACQECVCRNNDDQLDNPD